MLTVFVVDDSPAIRASVAMALKSANHTPVEFPTADDALERLKRGDIKPGLIIVDLTMPGMDGITFIKHARALPIGRFVPILVLTTESLQTKRQEARSAGATGWLVKPVSPADLLRTVGQVCPKA